MHDVFQIVSSPFRENLCFAQQSFAAHKFIKTWKAFSEWLTFGQLMKWLISFYSTPWNRCAGDVSKLYDTGAFRKLYSGRTIKKASSNFCFCLIIFLFFARMKFSTPNSDAIFTLSIAQCSEYRLISYLVHALQHTSE